MNKNSDNMTYLIDNKTFLCQHKKLDPLTDRSCCLKLLLTMNSMEKLKIP